MSWANICADGGPRHTLSSVLELPSCLLLAICQVTLPLRRGRAPADAQSPVQKWRMRRAVKRAEDAVTAARRLLLRRACSESHRGLARNLRTRASCHQTLRVFWANGCRGHALDSPPAPRGAGSKLAQKWVSRLYGRSCHLSTRTYETDRLERNEGGPARRRFHAWRQQGC